MSHETVKNVSPKLIFRVSALVLFRFYTSCSRFALLDVLAAQLSCAAAPLPQLQTLKLTARPHRRHLHPERAAVAADLNDMETRAFSKVKASSFKPLRLSLKTLEIWLSQRDPVKKDPSHAPRARTIQTPLLQASSSVADQQQCSWTIL